MSVDQYPQTTKLRAVRDDMDTIQDFVESTRYRLAEMVQPDGYAVPVLMEPNKTLDQILYEHFGIDQVALERERRHMLAALEGK